MVLHHLIFSGCKRCATCINSMMHVREEHISKLYTRTVYRDRLTHRAVSASLNMNKTVTQFSYQIEISWCVVAKELTGVLGVHPSTPGQSICWQLSMTSFCHVITHIIHVTLTLHSAVSAELDLDHRYMTVVEMSELSTGDREVPEGCKAQITHVIFDCDGLMLGMLVKFA